MITIKHIPRLLALFTALLFTFTLLSGCEGDPDVKEWLARGNLAADKGRLDEAIEHYDKALAMEATNTEALIGKSRVLVQQRKFPEAVQQLEVALENIADENVKKGVEQELGSALVLKAEGMWKSGKYREDAAAYEALLLRAAEIGPREAANKAYKLLAFYYDQEFEAGKKTAAAVCKENTCSCSGEGFNLAEEAAATRPCTSADACGSCIKHWDDPEAELALINKIYENINPAPEFDGRLKQAIADLKKGDFTKEYEEAIAKTTKPLVEGTPKAQLSETRITLIDVVGLGAQFQKAMAEIEQKIPADQTEKRAQLRLEVVKAYRDTGKRKHVQSIRDDYFKGFFGDSSLGLTAGLVNTYTLDAENFVTCTIPQPDPATPDVKPAVDITTCVEAPPNKANYLKVTSSIALAELSKLAWEFRLESMAKSKKDDGGGAPAPKNDDGGGTDPAPKKDDGTAPAPDGGTEAPAPK